jgi:hypothetical protein
VIRRCLWRDNLDETRDKQDENVTARLMKPMLIDAGKRLLVDAHLLIDAVERRVRCASIRIRTARQSVRSIA